MSSTISGYEEAPSLWKDLKKAANVVYGLSLGQGFGLEMGSYFYPEWFVDRLQLFPKVFGSSIGYKKSECVRSVRDWNKREEQWRK